MLAGLWIFADAHDVPLLQNVTSDLVLEKMQNSRTFFDRNDLTYVRSNTTETSKFRDLIRDVFKAIYEHELAWNDVPINDEDDVGPSLAFLQRSATLVSLRSSKWQCKYHVHPSGVSCK